MYHVPMYSFFILFYGRYTKVQFPVFQCSMQCKRSAITTEELPHALPIITV